jgi:hypothetical protein
MSDVELDAADANKGSGEWRRLPLRMLGAKKVAIDDHATFEAKEEFDKAVTKRRQDIYANTAAMDIDFMDTDVERVAECTTPHRSDTPEISSRV